MVEENFTLVGNQIFPIDWIGAALLLVLIPISYKVRGRIIPLAIILPALGFLVALLRVPFPYFEMIDLSALMVGLMLIRYVPSVTKSKPQPSPAFMVPAYLVAFMPLLLATQSSSGHQGITIDSQALRFQSKSKSEVFELGRNEIEINFQKCTFESGLTYAVYSSKGYVGLIYSDETYWNGHRLVSGDEVAKSISAFSDVKLHPFVAGVAPRWPDPKDKDRYVP